MRVGLSISSPQLVHVGDSTNGQACSSLSRDDHTKAALCEVRLIFFQDMHSQSYHAGRADMEFKLQSRGWAIRVGFTYTVKVEEAGTEIN